MKICIFSRPFHPAVGGVEQIAKTLAFEFCNKSAFFTMKSQIQEVYKINHKIGISTSPWYQSHCIFMHINTLPELTYATQRNNFVN